MALSNNVRKRKRRAFLRTAGLGIATASLAGCIRQFGGNGNEGGGLKIGFYGPFSGSTSNIGIQKQNAAKLSAKLINEAGGVHGEDIELLFADSESQPSSGRNAVNRLIQEEGVDVIGGGFHSDVALTTIKITNQHSVPQIIDEAVSGKIVERINADKLWNVFKTTPPSEAYAVGWRRLISQLQEQEIGHFPYENKRVALVGEDTSYGLSIMDSMKGKLNEIGWNVISENEVPLDETNFTSLLSRIKSNSPDIVWAIQTSSSGAGNLTKQFEQAGFKETHFLHNYGLTIDKAREIAGEYANGAITLLSAGPVDKLLKERGALQAWNKRYDMDITVSVALSYQNILVISEYVRAFDSIDAFRSASVDEWAKTVIDHKPIKGGTGYIDYKDTHQAAWGDIDTQSALGYQVADGDLNFVWPPELASDKFDESPY